jgi:hypothetical protein
LHVALVLYGIVLMLIQHGIVDLIILTLLFHIFRISFSTVLTQAVKVKPENAALFVRHTPFFEESLHPGLEEDVLFILKRKPPLFSLTFCSGIVPGDLDVEVLLLPLLTIYLLSPLVPPEAGRVAQAQANAKRARPWL